jgi:hypothetical protein
VLLRRLLPLAAARFTSRRRGVPGSQRCKVSTLRHWIVSRCRPPRSRSLLRSVPRLPVPAAQRSRRHCQGCARGTPAAAPENAAPATSPGSRVVHTAVAHTARHRFPCRSASKWNPVPDCTQRADISAEFSSRVGSRPASNRTHPERILSLNVKAL